MRKARLPAAVCCLCAACNAAARAQFSVYWQPVAISPAAVADDPLLSSMQCLDLRVTTTGDWVNAGLRALLPPGLTYYKNALGGNTRPDPALVGAHPALEFTTYVTAPGDTGAAGAPLIIGGWPDNPPSPISLGDPTAPIPGTFSATWGDLVVDPPNDYRIARLTFPQSALPNVVGSGFYRSFAAQFDPYLRADIPELGFSTEWLPDADGSWHVPSNWSAGQLPAYPDDVLIDVGGRAVRTVTISQGTVSIARLVAHEHIRVAGGTFSVVDDAQLHAGLTVDGGVLGVGEYRGLPVTVSGSGGTIERAILHQGLNVLGGANATVINNMTIHGSSTLNSGGAIRFTRQLVTTASLSGTGTLFCDGGTITLDGPGSLAINGGVTIRGAGGASILGRTPGTGGSIFVSNNGRIVADSAIAGTLHVAAENFTNAGTLEARGGCTLQVNRGTSTGQILARAGSEVAIDVLYTYSGTVGGDGTVRVLDEYRVDGIVNKTGSGVLRVNGRFFVFEGRTLDLLGGTLIHDYGEAYVPIRTLLVTGHNGGSWDGYGITSTTASMNPSYAVGHAEASALFTAFPATFAGETIDATTTLVRLTRYGDADLSGHVDLADFNRLAAHFNDPGVWSDGDFNYDGQVNLTDFNLLAGNFNLSAGPDGVSPQDWANLASAVPEPGALAMMGAFGLAWCRSRRRRVRCRRR